MDSPPASASYVVVACDATRNRTEHEIKLVVDHVRARRVFLSSGDKLLVLCVLHKVSHPRECYCATLFYLFYQMLMA